jgi:hypothetical protein
MKTRYTVADLEGFAARGMLAESTVQEILAGGKPVQQSEPFQLEGREPKREIKRPEQDMQHELCRLWSQLWPDSWEYTFHVPNELRSANRRLAAIFSGLGVKSGVPDLICVQRRGPFTGAAIENKSEEGRVSTHQERWLELFRLQGYFCGVAYSLAEAMELLQQFHSHPAR